MNTGLPSPLEGPSLDDPALHAWLRNYIRRRVPSDEADDLVQAVLCAALEARQRPADGVGLRRWLTGVARHLIAHHYEGVRTGRRGASSEDEGPEPAQEAPPFEERSLLRWAEVQAEAVAHGPETLDWMAREGEGEKLEAIAREAELPSARVRQRVSRLRRWMKGRYLAELALASSLAVALAWWWSRRSEAPGPKLADDAPAASVATPTLAELNEAAREQREAAAGLCARQDWEGCLESLDAAKRLDPAGDEAPAVGELRRVAGAEAQKAAEQRSRLGAEKGNDVKEPTGVKAPLFKPAPPAASAATPPQKPVTSPPPPQKTASPMASPPGTAGSQGLPPGTTFRAMPKKAIEPPRKGKAPLNASEFDSVEKAK